MKVIAHKINSIEDLNKLPPKFGVEIDLRQSKNSIVINHDPLYENTCKLDEYLENFNHSFIIANIKESGIETEVLNKIKEYTDNFFLLDVEIPFIVQDCGKNKNFLSIRYSEYESINTVFNLKNYADWVWIDTFTQLPALDERLSSFKTCLVSPDRWGRVEDIKEYIDNLNKLSFEIDAVMTDKEYLHLWS